jgi:hypothetical protein
MEMEEDVEIKLRRLTEWLERSVIHARYIKKMSEMVDYRIWYALRGLGLHYLEEARKILDEIYAYAGYLIDDLDLALEDLQELAKYIPAKKS